MYWQPVSMGAIPLFVSTATGEPPQPRSNPELDSAMVERIEKDRERAEREQWKRRIFERKPFCCHCGCKLVLKANQPTTANLVNDTLACPVHVRVAKQGLMKTVTIRPGVSVQMTQAEYIDMTRFEFTGIESIPDSVWQTMQFRLVVHARRMLLEAGQDAERSEALATEAIEYVRFGFSDWNPIESPNLLRWMFNRIRRSIQGREPTTGGSVATVAKKPRRRPKPANLQPNMDVKAVIENLPTIALLVGRLNELLNPIANPASGKTGGAD